MRYMQIACITTSQRVVKRKYFNIENMDVRNNATPDKAPKEPAHTSVFMKTCTNSVHSVGTARHCVEGVYCYITASAEAAAL